MNSANCIKQQAHMPWVQVICCAKQGDSSVMSLQSQLRVVAAIQVCNALNKALQHCSGQNAYPTAAAVQNRFDKTPSQSR